MLKILTILGFALFISCIRVISLKKRGGGRMTRKFWANFMEMSFPEYLDLPTDQRVILVQNGVL